MFFINISILYRSRTTTISSLKFVESLKVTFFHNSIIQKRFLIHYAQYIYLIIYEISLELINSSSITPKGLNNVIVFFELR